MQLHDETQLVGKNAAGILMDEPGHDKKAAAILIDDVASNIASVLLMSIGKCYLFIAHYIYGPHFNLVSN